MDFCAKGATLISLDRVKGASAAHLSVRFLSATEFVRQYAENLIKDGLFVRDAESLSPLELVSIDLYLPGFKVFRLKGQVTHVVTEANAEACGSPVGAGIQLVEPTAKFKEALQAYLQRVGHRADKLVLVTQGGSMALLESAGYWCLQIERTDLSALLTEHVGKVRAVVIGAPEYADFHSLVEGTEAENKLVLYNKTDANRLLTDLDALLPRPRLGTGSR